MATLAVQNRGSGASSSGIGSSGNGSGGANGNRRERERGRQTSNNSNGTLQIPDFETFLKSGSNTTIRVRASEEVDRVGTSSTSPTKTTTRTAMKGKEAALRDIEREMMTQDGNDDDDGSEDEMDGPPYASSTIRPHRTTPQLGSPAMLQGSPNGQVIMSGSMPIPDSPAMSTGSSTRSAKALPPAPISGSGTAANTGLDYMDTKRRSQYRTAGTAQATDLNTLLKTARAGSGTSPSAKTVSYDLSGGVSGSDRENMVARSNESSNSTAPSPVVRDRSRLSSDNGTIVSAGSGSRRPRTSPEAPTVSSLAAAIESPSLGGSDTASRQRGMSVMSDHGSFVHVNPAVAQAQQPQGRERQYSGSTVASARSALRRVRSRDQGLPQVPQGYASTSNLGLGIEHEVQRVPSGSSQASGGKRGGGSKKLVRGSEDTYISNAMRKTSGFFRKTFGNREQFSVSSYPSSSAAPSSRSGSTSAPSTPVGSRFPTSSYQPPVPSMPAAYSSNGSTATSNANSPSPKSRASFDTGNYRSLNGNPPNRHDSVSSTTASPPRMPNYRTSSSAATSNTSPGKVSLGGRFSTFSPSFRTSHSSSSATDLNITSSPARNGMKSSSTTSTMNLSEHDRLEKELHHWQLTEEKMEGLLDQGTSPGGPGGGDGDYSMNTVRAKSSQQPPPRTPPQMFQRQSQVSSSSNDAQNRSRALSSSGAAVMVAGSLPSPPTSPDRVTTRTRTSIDGVDQIFMSGSMPSPVQRSSVGGTPYRAANGVREDSTSTQGTNSSTATDDTLGARQTQPVSPGTVKLASRGPTTKAVNKVNPNSSSFWLDSSGSSTDNDAEGGVNDESSPELPSKPRVLLSPNGGKQIRKRVPSSNTASPVVEGNADRTGSIRLVPSQPSTPQMQPDQAGKQAEEFNAKRSNANAGLGLGLGMRPTSAPSATANSGPSLAPNSIQDGGKTPTPEAYQQSPQRSLASPQMVSVPRLVTQSPSPAHQQTFSVPSSSSPAGTPSRITAAGINMYSVGSRSPSMASSTNGVLPKRSSSGLRTPILGIPEDSGSNMSSPVQQSPSAATNGSPLPLGLPERAKVFAERCWDEDETFLKKEKIAEWLGGVGDLNQAALGHYLEKFDFKGLRLDGAFRRLCEKLYLRAETQQVDRILAAFSAKYFEDNPETPFGNRDIIHAAAYAMLLLNTDLHVADVTSRMSRTDFVQNTMAAIKAQTASPPLGMRTPNASYTPTMNNGSGVFDESVTSPASAVSNGTGRGSVDRFNRDMSRTSTKRSGSASASSSRTGLDDLASWGGSNTNLSIQSPGKGGRPVTADASLPTSRSNGSMPSMNSKTWENEMESMLKEIYAAVKATPIMQPLAYSQLAPPEMRSASASSSPYGSINRTPSRRSQASLVGGDRNAYKRNSIRGFLGASHESLRASSPTPSAGTSMSGGFSGNTSFGSTATNATSYYPTMGFASNLSHSIIREQQEEDARSDTSDTSATDEELALLGAPWAKEGLLQKKRYWDAPNKRSKDKNWSQVFAVIEKGDLKMFQFGGSGLAGGHRGGVGGGNWLSNAQVVGEITLAHALCSAMPPPGYNRSRPHVLVLTMSNGGSYFFQAGTEDLVNEWVLTCNYWAGRTSKEPLLGGVSNMDYGWNRVTGSSHDADNDMEDLASVRSGRSGHSRKSRMSYAGSVSRHSVMDSGMDRINLQDWHAPQPPSTHSNLTEDAQAEALKKHCVALQKELEKHNELRTPMMKLYSSRSLNAAKANTNWETKAKYLLAELVKYQIYMDALKVARTERQNKRDEKKVNRLLEEADDDASINDPVYSPQPESAATFAEAQVHALGIQQNEDDEEGDGAAHRSQDRIPMQMRRSSGTTTHTAATSDFYEATEGRTSPEDRL